MEKSVTNIRDLVVSAMTIGPTIERKAEGGDPESCFQMGMIYLLGVEKPASFRMAASFFSRKSLESNSYALRILGFLNECDGKFALAFQHYAKAFELENENASDTYLQKVAHERKLLHEYFNKLVLPKSVINEEISKLLDNYKKGKSYKKESCSKLASLCADEFTCLEAAEASYETKDYFTAKMWLNKGGVDSSNPLYGLIEKQMKDSRKKLLDAVSFQTIDVIEDSLIPVFNPDLIYADLKKVCDDIASDSQRKWQEKGKATVAPIVKKQKDEEHQLQLQEQEEEEKRKERRKQYIIAGSIFVFWFFVGIGASNSWGFSDLLTSLFLSLITYGCYRMVRTPKKKKNSKKRKT